jgi:hypothetical protein
MPRRLRKEEVVTVQVLAVPCDVGSPAWRSALKTLSPRRSSAPVAARRSALEIVMLAVVCRLYTDHPLPARRWSTDPQTRFANWGEKYWKDNFSWLCRSNSDVKAATLPG